MNLNDFPLHQNDKIVIEKWQKSYDKPLFISGNIGIGKTSLYETLLKDYSIVVVEHKLIKNYEEFIKNTILDYAYRATNPFNGIHTFSVQFDL